MVSDTVTGAARPRHTATPAARRLADQYGVDLATLQGSGGRIYRRHVAAAATAASAASTPEIPAAAGPGTPAALALTELDYHTVDRARRTHRERWHAEHGAELTRLPFVLRAVVDGLRAFPELNAPPGDRSATGPGPLHLGVVTDLTSDARVIRDAGDWRLRALARAADRVAGVVAADGGDHATFTVAALDVDGALLTPVPVEPPQVAVLAFGPARSRPVSVPVDGDHGIVVHPVGQLTMTFDPARVAGQRAAAFIEHVRQILETRTWPTEL